MGLCRRCGEPLNGDPRVQCAKCRKIQAANDAALRERRMQPIKDWKRGEHKKTATAAQDVRTRVA